MTAHLATDPMQDKPRAMDLAPVSDAVFVDSGGERSEIAEIAAPWLAPEKEAGS